MNKVFTFVVLLIIILGCSRKEEGRPELIIIDKLDEIEIQVDSSMNTNFASMSLFEKDSKSYLVGLDIIFQSINIFSLAEKRLIKRIPISEDGENGMLKIDGLYFHNFDSIFLVHRYPTKVYVVDSSGIVRNRLGVSNPLPVPYSQYKYLLEVGFFSNQVYFNPRNESLHLQIYYDIRPSMKGLRMPFIAEYFLNEDMVKNVYASRPKEYLDLLSEKVFYGAARMNPRFWVIDTLTYVAYPFEHILRVYSNKSGNEIQTVTCKSGFVSEFALTSVEYLGAEETNKYNTEEPSYHGLLYDQYRELFYRVVKHKQELKDATDKKNLFNESQWSILVLDKKLNVVGEALFPAKRYDFTNVFVNKDGLLVKHLDQGDGNIKITKFAIKLKD